ncbi:chemotaxis protein CheW [Oceanobacillus piezotolerans]|uniref:Chemotaxis protein CheW n=1 Tax=Oceanobacillus piezotolerans TaxID=2448030 RepID=A0A498D7B7_9BACI|nr:chemotaxis protein CheW [Oceanobacillus piezotolerans]RLL45336.1 chemotaxis protein CheW [Oceanobacillus piezotolerans]
METQQSAERKVIVFQIENEEYAIPVKQVGSIEKSMTITRVPKVPNYVKGVINLRGVVTPVIDLRSRFGIEEKVMDEESRIIIVYLNEIEVGFIVDAANDVIDIPEGKIEPVQEVINAVNEDYIEGVAHLEQRLLILLDIEKILKHEKVEELVEG